MQVLLIDNNDSFTYNLAQLVKKVPGSKLSVLSYDDLDSNTLSEFDKIIISPGPGLPDDFPKYKKWLEDHASGKSILGICMGHEIIASFYGASLVRLPVVQHGIMERITVTDGTESLFNDLAREIDVGLYHSWYVSNERLPRELKITAIGKNGHIMGLSHKKLDVKSLQFHPESYMTKNGLEIMRNWLRVS